MTWVLRAGGKPEAMLVRCHIIRRNNGAEGLVVSRWPKCPLLPPAWPWTSPHCVTPVCKCQQSNISHQIKPQFSDQTSTLSREDFCGKLNCGCSALLAGWKYKGQHRDKDSISANISSTLSVSMSREIQYGGRERECFQTIYWVCCSLLISPGWYSC